MLYICHARSSECIRYQDDLSILGTSSLSISSNPSRAITTFDTGTKNPLSHRSNSTHHNTHHNTQNKAQHIPSSCNSSLPHLFSPLSLSLLPLPSTSVNQDASSIQSRTQVRLLSRTRSTSGTMMSTPSTTFSMVQVFYSPATALLLLFLLHRLPLRAPLTSHVNS